MSASRELEITLAEDRSRGLTTEGADDKAKHPRAVNIQFVSEGQKFVIKVIPHPDYARLFPVTRAQVPLTQLDLWAKVNDCTSVWRNKVVFYRTPLVQFYPFQERSKKPLSLLNINVPFSYTRMLKELAIAGQKLFQQVFLPPVEGYEEVHEIGIALQKLSATPNLWIKITSDSFYAPWNLMYLGDFKKDVSADKFWGYQHFIEHDTADSTSSRVLKPGLSVALHFDEAIDKQFVDIKCNEHIVELLKSYDAVSVNQRNTKDGFLDQLSKGAREEFFYFCCHAVSDADTDVSLGKARFMLTDLRSIEEQKEFKDDREAIEPDDLDVYAPKLVNRPVVFMNCCQVAKMNSVFYRGFAAKFLYYYASAVIGPNIEIPTVFARDFAKKFFKQFFRGGSDCNLGSVLLALRREFFDKHENPLGLVYLLYRGADIHIESPVLKSNP
jgi:hypothetical protein